MTILYNYLALLSYVSIQKYRFCLHFINNILFSLICNVYFVIFAQKVHIFDDSVN